MLFGFDSGIRHDDNILYEKKNLHQDLVVDVNLYVMTEHLLMVTVVFALDHMQEPRSIKE